MSKSLSKRAVMAKGALLAILSPKMAADAMPDLDAVLSGVKRKNWLDKKPGIIAALTPKLAGDVDLQEVVQLLDSLDDQGSGEDPDIAQDSPADAVLEMLRGKISDEDLAAVKSKIEELVGAKTADDGEETAEEKAAREAKAKGAADEPADKPKGPDMVSKGAMDAAIANASKQATKNALQTGREIRDAEEAVKPFVGKLAIAFDSAPDVYKAALEALKVNIENVHPSAYKHILEAQQRPGSKLSLAHDSSAVTAEGFDKRFPDATRLQAS